MFTVSGLFTPSSPKPPEDRPKPFLFKNVPIVRWHTDTAALPITKRIGQAGGYIYQVFSFIGSLFVKGGASTNRPLPWLVKRIADVAGAAIKYVQIGFKKIGNFKF